MVDPLPAQVYTSLPTPRGHLNGQDLGGIDLTPFSRVGFNGCKPVSMCPVSHRSAGFKSDHRRMRLNSECSFI